MIPAKKHREKQQGLISGQLLQSWQERNIKMRSAAPPHHIPI